MINLADLTEPIKTLTDISRGSGLAGEVRRTLKQTERILSEQHEEPEEALHWKPTMPIREGRSAKSLQTTVAHALAETEPSLSAAVSATATPVSATRHEGPIDKLGKIFK